MQKRETFWRGFAPPFSLDFWEVLNLPFFSKLGVKIGGTVGWKQGVNGNFFGGENVIKFWRKNSEIFGGQNLRKSQIKYVIFKNTKI